MAKYRKKYTDIEAIRWWNSPEVKTDDALAHELYRLGKFVYGFNGDENPKIDFGFKELTMDARPILWLKNCNGMREIRPGDFVVKTPTGCVYPLCPESFNMSYELLEE